MPAFTITKEFDQECAETRVPGYFSVNKFGRAPAGLQTTATDVWDRADATPTQQIWLAPTAARIHAIVSSSASDDGSPPGVGARTILLAGLQTWSSVETSEVIILNGTSSVNTANSYVIIHRMEVLTKGATNVNVGVIKATAASDSTITAVILAGKGQTLMAVYGVPSGYTFYMGCFYAYILKTGGASASADMTILYNPEPADEPTQFLTKHTFAVVKDGSSSVTHDYCPNKPFAGPGIIKVNGIASASDLDISAGFDGVLGLN